MMTITVSDAARFALEELYERTEGNLKLTTRTRGCAGVIYELVVSDTSNPNDCEVRIGNFSLYLDGDRFMYLIGTHIDHVDDLEGRRFVFSNKALDTCGCGNSFRVGGTL